MKFQRSPKGFTLIELLVVISIIAVLASLAVPAIAGALVKGQLIQAVNNARQIHMASFSMATDAATNSDPSIGWPGDLANAPADQLAYVTTLVNNGYLTGGDLKVFACAGVPSATTMGSGTNLGNFTTPLNTGFIMYMVGEGDATNTVFITTRNFDAVGMKLTGTTPFTDKGFVVCRKGGDTGQYKTVASGTASYAKPTKQTLLQ